MKLAQIMTAVFVATLLVAAIPASAATGNYTLGVQSGTTSDTYAAENLPNANVMGYDTIDLAVAALEQGDVDFVLGGKTRQSSTLNALRFLNKKNSFSKVLIHDAARPNFSLKLFSSIIKNIKNARAVIPKIKVQDAIKQIIDSSKEEYLSLIHI